MKGLVSGVNELNIEIKLTKEISFKVNNIITRQTQQ